MKFLGNLGTISWRSYFKLIWTFIQDRSELWKPWEKVARYYRWNSYPTHAAEIETILIILFASLDPCLFRREADARLKDKPTLLDPFDGRRPSSIEARFQFRKTLHGNLRRSIPCCEGSRHTREFSQLSVMNKYGKEPNSRKVIEVHPSLPPSYLHHRYVLKSSMGRKSKHCPDPNSKKKYKSWISRQNNGNLNGLNHQGKKKLSLR